MTSGGQGSETEPVESGGALKVTSGDRKSQESETETEPVESGGALQVTSAWRSSEDRKSQESRIIQPCKYGKYIKRDSKVAFPLGGLCWLL